MVTKASFCRICQAFCGVLVDVEDDRITRIIGDKQNPMSRGFACPKGLRGGDFLHGPDRLTHSLRRSPEGSFERIEAVAAAQQIGSRLQQIIGCHGPDSVAMFLGTQGIFATLTNPVARSWFAATGSRKLFTTMTIDQSAKWIVSGRMGEYRGGRHGFTDADVWMLVGTNPLVSVNGGAGDGVLMQSPSVTLAEARARGLKLIVIDPRRTETAFKADLHIAPRPGHDALILAGLLNIILSEGLHDAGFCAAHVNGLEDLVLAVREVTPGMVAQVADVAADDLIEAARLFAQGPRGAVSTGTGVCMGPHSNVTEHLAMCLNVVCGRFQREGELADANVVLGRDNAPRAEVAAPDRSWETGYRSRLGAGLIRGELPSNTLSDEILEPGADRVRALIVSAGNPILAMPDAKKALRAFTSLELLVCIDTRLSETARMADYVIAPTMLYERSDHTLNLEKYFARPYAMYSDPLVTPPAGVIEDWQFFWHLARAMGLPLSLAGEPIDMTAMPSSDALLARMTRGGRVPLNDVRRAEHGFIADPRTTRVMPPSEQARHARLELLPPDVAAELKAALSVPEESTGMRLVVRRMREVMNSLGREIERLPRQPFNPAFMHPADMQRLDLDDNMRVRLTTQHGTITAMARSDATLRPGVIAITHGWSSDPTGAAQNVNEITGNDEHTQLINFMPQLTAQPVTVEVCSG